MIKRKVIFYISICILVVSSILLTTGSQILVASLSQNSNIPFGTFVTWLGMISLPSCMIFGINRIYHPLSKRDTNFSLAFRASGFLAILWLPVSYYLAGNISFSFAEKAEFQGGQLAMEIFWIFSYFVVAFPVILLILFCLLSVLFKSRIP